MCLEDSHVGMSLLCTGKARSRHHMPDPEPASGLENSANTTTCHCRCVLTNKSEAELAKLGKLLTPWLV